jgi:hypothetical protein
MRTTLTIDADILSAARQIAQAKSTSIGKVISELARRGLEARARITTRQGFPVFAVSTGAPPLTPEDVRRDEEEL